MRITIENFGAIKYFEFDTDKDMYLIFGKNSVGKSYGISLVYLILKSLKKWANFESTVAYFPLISKYFDNEQVHNSVIEDVSIDTVKNDLIHFLNTSFVADLNISLINSFNHINNLPNQFSNENLKIILDFVHAGAIFELGMEEENDGAAIKIINYQFTQVFDSFYKEVACTKGDIASIFIASRLYKELPNRELYYLPASRSGLYQGLGSFAQIAAELSKSRSLISKPIHLPTISEPLADYFLRLSEIDNNNQTGLAAYTNDIENEIMSGQVEFDNETKRLFFRPKDTQLKLDLSSTSSMVSEMAPIVAYLKHVLPPYIKIKFRGKEREEVESEWCGEKPLIFIEEPEAHLHPETQVKLMNVLARLVKDDKIKLVMTSHSNYIFNKASNLVMDGKIDPDKFKAVLFRMTETGSVAENMATDAYGIDDDNFIDTAESLYEEKLAIINKLNG
ncbi:MAG: AAA family ATPase [Methylovulum miyakonense]|uniref:AAA family ATPase n=1 Tax=Methylovulum miyakonense TaxID=645578 RepID=UPI003BB6D4C7